MIFAPFVDWGSALLLRPQKKTPTESFLHSSFQKLASFSPTALSKMLQTFRNSFRSTGLFVKGTKIVFKMRLRTFLAHLQPCLLQRGISQSRIRPRHGEFCCFGSLGLVSFQRIESHLQLTNLLYSSTFLCCHDTHLSVVKLAITFRQSSFGHLIFPPAIVEPISERRRSFISLLLLIPGIAPHEFKIQPAISTSLRFA